jgi:hypothetical protein
MQGHKIYPNRQEIKQIAREIAAQKGIALSSAYENVAHKYGFKSWGEMALIFALAGIFIDIEVSDE